MGGFRKKKNILQTDCERNKFFKEIPGEKNSCTQKISLMAYNQLEKNLTPLNVWKKKKFSISKGLGKNYYNHFYNPSQ